MLLAKLNTVEHNKQSVQNHVGVCSGDADSDRHN